MISHPEPLNTERLIADKNLILIGPSFSEKRRLAVSCLGWNADSHHYVLVADDAAHVSYKLMREQNNYPTSIVDAYHLPLFKHAYATHAGIDPLFETIECWEKSPEGSVLILDGVVILDEGLPIMQLAKKAILSRKRIIIVAEASALPESIIMHHRLWENFELGLLSIDSKADILRLPIAQTSKTALIDSCCGAIRAPSFFRIFRSSISVFDEIEVSAVPEFLDYQKSIAS